MIKVTPRLGELLKKKGYTSQLAFSKEHNIPQTVVNRFDKTQQYTSHYLFMIARALGVSVEDLFEIEEIEE